MSDDTLIERSAQRLFSENVDKALLERFEAGAFPDALWRLVVDGGFDRALATDEAGGIGEGWSGVYPILRGIGYWHVPLPLGETMVAAMLLSSAGLEVPEGPVAIVEAGLDGALAVSGGRVSGRAPAVPWAGGARWLLVSDGASLALVDLHDAAASRVEPRLDVAKLPCGGVVLDGARAVASAANPLPALERPVRTLGAIARSAMLVGALERVLEQSVSYVNDRVQFGKPIGRNQAIQQQLALIAGDVAAARTAALVACADAPSPGATDCGATVFGAAVAKVRCGEAASRAAGIAHQVHGAIGFTYEHMLNYGTRRLWAWREQSGSDAWWAERLGRAAIAAGQAGFWPSITQRRFDAGIALDGGREAR